MALNAFFANWYFHIPNYVLAALMYSLLGRFILSFFFPPDATNYIFRAFVRITDPVLVPVRFVTPAAVPHMVVLIFAALWMVVLRFALLIALSDTLPAAATG